MSRRAIALLAVVLACAPAAAQTPDFGGEVAVRTLDGLRVNARTDPANHTRNRNALTNDPMWGGCAPSSVRTALLYSGVDPVEVERFWQLAQRRIGRGGTSPDMMGQMLREIFGDRLKWVSYVGYDTSILDDWSAKGYLLCGTMAWGRQYRQQIIAHMVNYPHVARGEKCVIEDNNDEASLWRIVPDVEAYARWKGNGPGWVLAITQLPPRILRRPTNLAEMLILGTSVLLTASSAVVIVSRLQPQPRFPS